MKNVIFQIQGGIGKSIAATAVVEAMKKHHKKDNIIVITAFPDVFLNNPNVHRCFSYNQLSYFYRDYIEKKEIKTYLHDPYLDEKYIRQDKHLIEVWCEMYGIPYSGEQPKFHLTKRETDFYTNEIVTEFTQNNIPTNKPILVLQTNGGADNQAVKYSWARDLPATAVTKIVEELKDEYTIIHLRRPDQQQYQHTITFNATIRKIVVLLTLSQKRLLIDSFAQHACAALGLPATVCWIANKPEVFGYKIHKNVLANKFKKKAELKNSFLHPFDITGDISQFPYNTEDEIFDTDVILETLQ